VATHDLRGAGDAGRTAGDAGTLLGFTAADGVLTYADSDLYPGGLLCQPSLEFILRAISVRPKGVYTVTAGGVRTFGDWLRSRQDQLQSMALEHIALQVQPRRATCRVDLETLSHYPTEFASGMPANTSRNGLDFKGNVAVLRKAVPIAAEDSTHNQDQIFAVLFKPLQQLLDVAPPPPESEVGAQIVIPIEVILYGCCRDYCPPDNCPPGTRSPRRPTGRR